MSGLFVCPVIPAFSITPIGRPGGPPRAASYPQKTLGD